MGGERVHLVGIGGVGMSALARLYRARGYRVTGCDRAASPVLDRLTREGIPTAVGHDPGHLAGCDRLVVSAAVSATNPEVEAARRLGIPVRKRAEALGELLAGGTGVAVAGTHGKSTTTALIGLILEAAGFDPTCVVGADVPAWESNLRVGAGPYWVAEADEYDHSFLTLRPEVAVVTTVEYDHPDCFGDFASLYRAFAAFVGNLPPGGVLIVGADSPAARRLAGERPDVRVVGYGLADGPEFAGFWTARNIRLRPGGGAAFEVFHGRRPVGRVESALPGRHNVANALAAFAAAAVLGIPVGVVASVLSRFAGVGRRFEPIGRFRGAPVFSDYAHHPTEIRVTVEAARAAFPGRRIVGVFQPHTFSRTRALFAEFVEALGTLDGLVLGEIYPAREQPRPGDPTGAALFAAVEGQMGGRAVFLPDLSGLGEALAQVAGPDDIILVMGAGDIDEAARRLVKKQGNGW
jgi:UDP-N-acetylmuramate--alanine ligase